MASCTGERDRGDRMIPTALGFLAGVLVGGLAGAVTTLLLAPQSGQRTRDQILTKGLILRDQAPGTMDDIYGRVRAAGLHIPVTVHTQAENFQSLTQDTIDDQTDRWSPIAGAELRSVQAAG